MKLLAWDTSSKTGSIAAIEWDPVHATGRGQIKEEMAGGPKLVAEWTLDVSAVHSEKLLWAIHQVIEAANWKLEEIDVFGVGVGPGSFTGLRIGMTTARTLAHVQQKPLIGVSSLATLARPTADWISKVYSDERLVLAVLRDAHQGEIYSLVGAAKSVRDCVAPKDGDYPGVWKRGVDEKVFSPAQLVSEIKKRISQGKVESRYVLLGDSKKIQEVSKGLPQQLELRVPREYAEIIQGRFLARLAWEGVQSGVERKALEIHPKYLKPSSAERKKILEDVAKNVSNRGKGTAGVADQKDSAASRDAQVGEENLK